jgi:predicted lipoprotein with Yx(FWY)xxD motif
MARLSILALCAVAIFAIGCGDSDDDGTTSAAAAGEQSGEAMKKEPAEGDAMKEEPAGGEAMKDESAATEAATVANRNGKRGRTIKAVGSQFGKVVADARGEAFYLFDKEQGKRSQCYGACARAWPPVLTRGRPQAGKGVKASLLGTTRRKNGKLQATYKGHPLYYYVDDEPGLILCQDVAEFGGLWLVVKPNGDPVT